MTGKAIKEGRQSQKMRAENVEETVEDTVEA